MTVIRPLLMTALLAAVALAGCSDDAPSGEFSSDRHSLTLGTTAEVEIDIQPGENGYDPGTDPTGGMIPYEDLCALDEAAGQADQEQCQDAHTSISVHIMELPDPGSGSYELVLTGEQERTVGTIQMDENDMWVLEESYEGEDLSGQFNGTEVRYGDLVYARSGASSGTNMLELVLPGTSFAASYEGRELTVTVSGAPEGVSLTGWLVEENATGGLEHVEDFTVSGDEVTYTAENPIDHYAEAHIHVGDSKINLAIATVS